MLGKIEGRRGRGWQRMRWLDGITDSNGHEFEQSLEDSEGQRSLACCSPWGLKESDTTERLNNNNLPFGRTPRTTRAVLLFWGSAWGHRRLATAQSLCLSCDRDEGSTRFRARLWVPHMAFSLSWGMQDGEAHKAWSSSTACVFSLMTCQILSRQTLGGVQRPSLKAAGVSLEGFWLKQNSVGFVVDAKR